MGQTAAVDFDTNLSKAAALRAMTPLMDRPAVTSAMQMPGGSLQPWGLTDDDRIARQALVVA